MKTRRIAWLAIAVCAGFALQSAAGEPGSNPEELFQKLDKNSDGKITSDEVGDEQARFYERLLRIGDQDKNSELSKDEFLEALKNDDRPVPGGFGRQDFGGGREGRQRMDPEHLFERMDANRDGKLSLDELPDRMRERMQPLFERLGKKELTREEFVKERPGRGFGPEGKKDGPRGEKFGPEAGKPPEGGFGPREKDRPEQRGFGRPGHGDGPQAGGRPRLPRFFEMLDSNGDHRLSQDEMSRAAEVFKKMDEDGDGQLDPRELLGPPPDEFARRPGRGPDGFRPDRPDRRGPEDGPQRRFRRPGEPSQQGGRPDGRPDGPPQDGRRPFRGGPDGERPPRDENSVSRPFQGGFGSV
jgi:Ca2+-binding EF-hand superfamily protein